MIDPNSFKAVPSKTTNELTDSHTIVDVGERTQDTVQKVGIIGAIVLAIIVVLVIVLIIKKKRRDKIKEKKSLSAVDISKKP